MSADVLDLDDALQADVVISTLERDHGIAYTFLGEDGECGAVMWGHGLDPLAVVNALGIETDLDHHPEAEVTADDLDLEEGWAIATHHAPDCERDGCYCDESAWFIRPITAEQATALPAGYAIPVTWWED